MSDTSIFRIQFNTHKLILVLIELPVNGTISSGLRELWCWQNTWNLMVYAIKMVRQLVEDTRIIIRITQFFIYSI